MTRKSKTPKANIAAPLQTGGVHIETITVTGPIMPMEQIAAVTALARASEAHAVALQKIADAIKGSSAPAVQINSRDVCPERKDA